MRYAPILLLLASCAQPTVWTKPDATQADFNRDRDQCLYEANLATASYSDGQNARSVAEAAGQGFGRGLAIAMRQGELYPLCMRARGYSQMAAPSTPPSTPPTSATGDRLVMCKLPGGSNTYILAADCSARGGAPD